jgi:hypothetical protein
MSLIYELWRATPSELRATLRGWREPLAAPRVIRRLSPFTGTLLDEDSWDPTPDVPVRDESPISVPFDSIHAGVDDEGLGVLCKAISDANGGKGDFRLRPALIGPYEGPWVFLLPPGVTHVLSQLEDVGLAAEFWLAEEERDVAPQARSKVSSRPELVDNLRAFSAFSRLAVSAGQQVYLYVSL